MLLDIFLLALSNKEYTRVAYSYNILILQRNYNPQFFDMDFLKKNELDKFVKKLDRLVWDQIRCYQMIIYENECKQITNNKPKEKVVRLYEIKERLKSYRQIDETLVKETSHDKN